MTDSPQLKLTRTLPVTVGAATKVLRVVRVIATQTAPHGLTESVPDKPFSMVAHEKIEITFRADIADFYDELMGATHADPVPYATLQFGEHAVKAMMRPAEVAAPWGNGTPVLLTFMLLRVPVAALAFDDEDGWERDEEYGYSRNGTNVIAVRPKDDEPTAAGTALAKFDEWLAAGGDVVAAGIDIDAYRAVLQRQDGDERAARSQPSPAEVYSGAPDGPLRHVGTATNLTIEPKP